MAYQDAGKEAQQRAEALVKAVNSALEAHYKAVEAKDKKAVPQKLRISVSVAKGKGGVQRTPEEQAQSVLEKHSWTLNSAHMADGAKHIWLKQGGALTWSIPQIAKQKEAFKVLNEAWNKAMHEQDLRNYTGQKGFAVFSDDPLHMELPDAKLPDNDPRVVRALEVYAKATRIEGHAKNTVFENKTKSHFQKEWLRQYDEKLAKSKAAKAP